MEVDAHVLRTAARFWAAERRMGVPTADPQHLDIDMILSGHAAVMAESYPMDEVVIATGNLRHLRMFADAREWASNTQICCEPIAKAHEAHRSSSCEKQARS